MIGGVGVGSFDVVDEDGVNNVDAEGLLVLIESLPSCLNMLGLDGVFEGDCLAPHLIHYNDVLTI